jgi:hypothetical protein
MAIPSKECTLLRTIYNTRPEVFGRDFPDPDWAGKWGKRVDDLHSDQDSGAAEVPVAFNTGVCGRAVTEGRLSEC